jgi:hypothetical protein
MLTPRISNGGLLVVLKFVLCKIVRVPGQVIALNSATAHTLDRCGSFLKSESVLNKISLSLIKYSSYGTNCKSAYRKIT